MQSFSEGNWRMHSNRIREWIINAENMEGQQCGIQNRRGQDGCEEIPEDVVTDNQDQDKKVENSWRNIANLKKK